MFCSGKMKACVKVKAEIRRGGDIVLVQGRKKYTVVVTTAQRESFEEVGPSGANNDMG